MLYFQYKLRPLKTLDTIMEACIFIQFQSMVKSGSEIVPNLVLILWISQAGLNSGYSQYIAIT